MDSEDGFRIPFATVPGATLIARAINVVDPILPTSF